MQRKSLGQHLWNIVSPLVLRYGIAYVVDLVIIGAYAAQYFKGVTEAVETEAQMYEHLEVIMEAILPYSTQIGAVASLITIPFLIRMVKKDRIQEKLAGFVANAVAPKICYVYAAVMSGAVAVALNNILLLVNIAEYSEAYQESAELLYAPSFPVQILCLGIIYPIVEEYIFRGLIFRRIRTGVSAARAIFASAFIFGLYHGNSVQMIYGLLSGIMLAYFYEKLGSLKAPIIAHMTMNIIAVILTEVDAFTWMFAQPIRMAVITVLCAAVGSSMFVLIRQNIQVMQEESPEEIES